MIGDNPFERQTQNLKTKQNQQLLQKLYHLVKLTNNKQITQSIDMTLQIEQLLHKMPDTNNQLFLAQIRFHREMYRAILGENQELQHYSKNIFQDNDEHGQIRVMMLFICSKLRNEEGIDDEYVGILEKMLEKCPEYKEEILCKLLGCKDISRMYDLTFQEIEQLTTNQITKAIKFQVGADWKYCVGDVDTAIRMKTQAIRLWSLKEKHDKAKKAKQEQIAIIQQQQQNNSYRAYLQLAKRVTTKISKLNTPTKKSFLINKTKQSLKFMISQTIKNIKIDQQDQAKSTQSKSLHKSRKSDPKNSELKSSVFRKQQKIQEKIERTREFLKKTSKDDLVWIDFIENSKFSVEMQREFTRKLGIFNRIVRKHYRFFRDRMFENDARMLQEIRKKN